MSFLAKDELKTKVPISIVNIITNSDDNTVDTIIEENIDIVRGYLYQYYDTEAIFSATGADRSKAVLKHLKAIVVHEIYTSRSKEMNETAKNANDDALTWLEQVAKGIIKPDLPKRKVDTNGDGVADSDATFMKLGGRKAYKNHW
jgi:phage gp36-like protein